eukprot:TRINITY_DN5536_c0_g2_i1.p1 TRINITY_DN5536_c0_g2~~TRINITY_DN5536_c0_g2_i1.p1  ORF type:complete len:238 (+),score=65.72 TRINITY_DN5536_c0_g2_i1:71-715(+)
MCIRDRYMGNHNQYPQTHESTIQTRIIMEEGVYTVKYNKYITILNWINGIGVIAIAILRLVLAADFKIIQLIGSVFLVLFGAMILSSQVPNLKIVADHFNFLNKLLGRGLFNIYLASVVSNAGSNADPKAKTPVQLASTVAALCLLCVGGLYIGSHCCKICTPENVNDAKQRLITEAAKETVKTTIAGKQRPDSACVAFIRLYITTLQRLVIEY